MLFLVLLPAFFSIPFFYCYLFLNDFLTANCFQMCQGVFCFSRHENPAVFVLTNVSFFMQNKWTFFYWHLFSHVECFTYLRTGKSNFSGFFFVIQDICYVLLYIVFYFFIFLLTTIIDAGLVELLKSVMYLSLLFTIACCFDKFFLWRTSYFEICNVLCFWQ